MRGEDEAVVGAVSFCGYSQLYLSHDGLPLRKLKHVHVKCPLCHASKLEYGDAYPYNGNEQTRNTKKDIKVVRVHVQEERRLS